MDAIRGASRNGRGSDEACSRLEAAFLRHAFTRSFPKVFVSAVALIGFQSWPLDAQIQTQTRPPVRTQTKNISYSTNIPYITGGGSLQQLNLYVPTDRNGEPLIVVVHGGGWVNGDKAGDSLNLFH